MECVVTQNSMCTRDKVRLHLWVKDNFFLKCATRLCTETKTENILVHFNNFLLNLWIWHYNDSLHCAILYPLNNAASPGSRHLSPNVNPLHNRIKIKLPTSDAPQWIENDTNRTTGAHRQTRERWHTHTHTSPNSKENTSNNRGTSKPQKFINKHVVI